MPAMGSYAKTTILLATLSAILMLIGQAFGGNQGMVMAFGFAIVMNGVSYWFSDRIVLKMHGAKQVGPEHPLYGMVQGLATRAHLPMPRVYLIASPSPNAFATGRNPAHAAVAATEGLLQMLGRDEIEGVMAHEMAHVANRDILIQSVAATLGAAIMMLANMARWGAMFSGGRSDDRNGGSPIALIATALLAPIAAMIIQAAISRSREFAADDGGAKLAGSGVPLANALRKIEAGVQRAPLATSPAMAHMFIMAPFAGRGRGVLSLFSTHPPTAVRVERLMAMNPR
jgi:heat shock protein HtpX